MIVHEDRPAYLNLVANLSATLLKEELLAAKLKDDNFNDLTKTELSNKIKSVYSLAYELIEGANSYFKETIESSQQN